MHFYAAEHSRLLYRVELRKILLCFFVISLLEHLPEVLDVCLLCICFARALATFPGIPMMRLDFE